MHPAVQHKAYPKIDLVYTHITYLISIHIQWYICLVYILFIKCHFNHSANGKAVVVWCQDFDRSQNGQLNGVTTRRPTDWIAEGPTDLESPQNDPATGLQQLKHVGLTPLKSQDSNTATDTPKWTERIQPSSGAKAPPAHGNGMRQKKRNTFTNTKRAVKTIPLPFVAVHIDGHSQSVTDAADRDDSSPPRAAFTGSEWRPAIEQTQPPG